MMRRSCATVPMQVTDAAHHVRVARAVKAITSNTEARRQLGCDRVLARALRQRSVKSRIEYGDVGNRAESLPRCFHCCQRRRVVQRREAGHFGNSGNARVIEQLRARMPGTAVDDAMRHRREVCTPA